MLEKIHLAINDSYKLRCHEINDVLTEDPIAATDKGIDDKIVFLCGEQKIEIRMKIIQMLSPVVRKLLGEELCSHSHARTEGQKYFISLDAEIDPEAVERIFNTRVDEDVRMSQHQLQQFKTFVQMLQISSRWFSLQDPSIIVSHSTSKEEEEEVRFKSSNYQKGKDEEIRSEEIVTLAETEQTSADSSPHTDTVSEVVKYESQSCEENNVVKTKKDNIKAKMNSGSRKFGTKRKNINDAIDNITAKKRRAKALESDTGLENAKKETEGGDVVENVVQIEAKDDVKESSSPSVQDIDKPDAPAPSPCKVSLPVQCPEEECFVKFSSRPEFLQHMATLHLQVTLLEAYPYVKNKECSVCLSKESKKKFSAKTKNAWIIHILTHDEILDCFPPIVRETAASLPKRVRSNTKKMMLMEVDNHVEGSGKSDFVIQQDTDNKIRGKESEAKSQGSEAESKSSEILNSPNNMDVVEEERREPEDADTTQIMETDPASSCDTSTHLAGHQLLPMSSVSSQLSTEFPPPIAQSSTYTSAESCDQDQTLVTPVTQSHPCPEGCSSRTFVSHEELMRHLSLVHFMSDILDKFPFEVNSFV